MTTVKAEVLQCVLHTNKSACLEGRMSWAQILLGRGNSKRALPLPWDLTVDTACCVNKSHQ